MDALYVLGSGSAWEDRELRYSLRSLERHVRGVDRVFVVGETPAWLSSQVTAIRVPEPTTVKEASIALKVFYAFSSSDISDDAFFLNDDHVFLKDVDAKRYPYFHRGDLRSAIPKATNNKYRASLSNTVEYLATKGTKLLHYDIHCPIVYNRSQFVNLLPAWTVSRNLTSGLVVKSTYSNLVGVVPGPQMADCKLNGDLGGAGGVKSRVAGRHVFSFADSAIAGGVCDFLKTTFPTKSKYESF